MLAEGADHVLDWRNPNYVYTAKTAPGIKLLLKNYKLSDDIAFRFSNKGWSEFPLDAGKFAAWVSDAKGDTINLFMDYETFGEHQWEDTGIFKFLDSLPDELFKRGHEFMTPSQVAEFDPVAELDIHHPGSWADLERDLTAWLGNKMQHASINELYALGRAIKNSNNPELIQDWRKLQTSDHFYYMCTKWFSDGDVHKYFSPYDSPYDSYMAFMNVLNDMVRRLTGKTVLSERPSMVMQNA